ncbi:MAG: alpha/beta hydrolase [Desulfobacteraceae bacterium]|nr:alpha/beta hydrolase [Desulfobacteraceae bacterium]
MMTETIPQPKRQSIGSTEMSYLDYGHGSSTVVLLHATGFLPWLWHPIATTLAERHRVIVPALYAHRQADPHQGGLGWLQLAEDLKQLCDGLNLTNIRFVGHSMGGAVATLAHTVCGLPAVKMVLIEPIFLPDGFYRFTMTVAQHPLASKAIKRRNLWRDHQEARQDFESKSFFQTWDKQILALYVEHGLEVLDSQGVRLVCSPDQEAALFIGGSQYDPWPVLPRITCPTLVVEGQVSENRPWIDLKRVASLIPKGRYTEVQGAGHLVPMEKPRETAKLIQAFFNTDPGVTGT